MSESDSLLRRPRDDACCTRPKRLKGEIAVVDVTVGSYEQRDRRRLEVRCQSDPEPAVAEANENQLIGLSRTFPLRGIAIADLSDAQHAHGRVRSGLISACRVG